MPRLKFVVFALIALGLWGFHLTLIGPLALAGAQEQAEASVAAAAGPLAAALEAQRSLTQAMALQVAGTPAAAWNAGPKAPTKPEAPSAERFNAVRLAASDVVGPDQKEAVFVAVINETGLLAATGSAEPAATAAEGVDLSVISQAGTTGATTTIGGTGYLLFSVPQAISDKNEVRQAGSIVVGLPVLPSTKVLERTQKSFNLTGLALVAGDKPVLSVGDAAEVTAAMALKGIAPLRSGAVRELGPLALPILVDPPVLAVGAHSKLEGTPFDVVATANSNAGALALAGYQVFALGGLAGLFLLTIVFTLIMGSGADQGPAMSIPPPLPLPPRRENTGSTPAFTPSETEAPPVGPEASPDDFDFPPSQAMSAVAPAAVTGLAPAYPDGPEPTSDPFDAPTALPPASSASAMRSQPPAPPMATAEQPVYVPQPSAFNATLNEEDDESQRTVAYPQFKSQPSQPPTGDPFAMAAAQEAEPQQHPDDNVDATRVAAIPAELIRAARAGASGTTGERPAIRSAAAMPKVASSIAPAAASGAADEEKHFQDVFRDFVATREKCHEPADGLTYEKFKAKLLKNKEQLVAKYNCRTVRFQVYVKEGKAALKATPVKD